MVMIPTPTEGIAGSQYLTGHPARPICCCRRQIKLMQPEDKLQLLDELSFRYLLPPACPS